MNNRKSFIGLEVCGLELYDVEVYGINSAICQLWRLCSCVSAWLCLVFCCSFRVFGRLRPLSKRRIQESKLVMSHDSSFRSQGLSLRNKRRHL